MDLQPCGSIWAALSIQTETRREPTDTVDDVRAKSFNGAESTMENSHNMG